MLIEIFKIFGSTGRSIVRSSIYKLIELKNLESKEKRKKDEGHLNVRYVLNQRTGSYLLSQTVAAVKW